MVKKAKDSTADSLSLEKKNKKKILVSETVDEEESGLMLTINFNNFA